VSETPGSCPGCFCFERKAVKNNLVVFGVYTVKFVDVKEIIGDDYRAVILCEYKKELALIKKLIEEAQDAVERKRVTNTWSFDGMCYMFARSIVSYAAMAYDNMLIGHFDASKMIMRAMIENNVCLAVIQKYKDEELWKYYLAQSYRDTISVTGRSLSKREMETFYEVCKDLGIEDVFLEKTKKGNSKKPYAFIDRSYGWTYKVNTAFTFSGVCNLVDKRDYEDFKMMSMYSHGTSIYLKIGSSSSMDSVMNMVSFFYYCLYKVVALFCSDSARKEFYDALDNLEEILERYVGEDYL